MIESTLADLACQCQANDYPFRCPVFDRDMGCELHAVCAGRFRPGERDRYRRVWIDQAEGRAAAVPPPRAAEPPPPRLTIGMATANESTDVWFTLQTLRLYHSDQLPFVELIVVDNSPPTSVHPRITEALCQRVGARFVHAPTPQGTAAPRDRIFAEARGDAVLVIDSHVLLWPGAVRRLIDWFHRHPGTLDLIHGPLLDDRILEPNGDAAIYATRMDPRWGADAMFGVWGRGDEPTDLLAPEFEIPMMGLGLFACRRETWPGFHPEFEEFGGEEGYVHEKIRRAGGRVLCLPFLRWAHHTRDARMPLPYAASNAAKFRNYALGDRELGREVERTIAAFQQPDDQGRPFVPEAECRKIVASLPPQPEWRPDSPAEREYRAAVRTPSEIYQHLVTLRRHAAGCETVVELGTRSGVSTRALIAARPKRLVAVDVEPIPEELATIAESAGVEFEARRESSLATEPVACDLLFVDSLHTAEQLAAELRRHAPHCRRRIALHDTETFGLRGEDGRDGLLKALGNFLAEHAAEWELERHHPYNNGLTVLRRWQVATDPSRGLGDDVAKAAHALGLDRLAKGVARWFGADCGCAGRQAVLNKWFRWS